MRRYHWDLLPPLPESFAPFHGWPRLVAQVLYNRGIRTAEQIEPFLQGDDRLSHDPFLLPGMQTAVTRIYQALLAGETIAVYGDYDVDGITATALLVQGLSILSGQAIPYIPQRLTEGYGLKITALEKLRLQGVGLVITVDCGITSCEEVARATKLGLDIIITDHHTCLPEIPAAAAVINPKLPDTAYPYQKLTAVGIAYKLVQALFQGIGGGEQISSFLDLVALGTVADMAPLTGENRYFVKQGLKRLADSPRPGLRELIARNNIATSDLTTESISWIIAPRLNAAGRIRDAMVSYNLLMTESAEEAQALALKLEEHNTERQSQTTRFQNKARDEVLATGITPLLLVSGDDYPEGITGLVAGRLAEEYYRPAVVIRSGETSSSGSCRSIPEFNITLALSRCQHLLTQFGGHAQAAGFSLPTKNIAGFRQQLLDIAISGLSGLELYPHLSIDAEIPLAEAGWDIFKKLQQLAPFGQGNQVPTFLSRGVEVVTCQPMGNSGGHLRLKLRDNGKIWDSVAFKQGGHIAEIASHLDIVYSLEIDRWRGEEKLRLNILDFAPA